MGGGGTKLGRSNPWQSKSASHSASFTSVLRPGTFRTCCALATTISKAPSRRAYTGFQYTPVLSIATCVQPSESNHSRKRNSSRVVWCQRFVSASGLAHRAKPATSRPSPKPDEHPAHSHVPPRFAQAPPLSGAGCAAGQLQTLLCVLPVSGCDKRWYLYRRGSVSYAGSLSSQSGPDLQAIAFTKACTTTGPHLIFMLCGAPKGACSLLQKLPGCTPTIPILVTQSAIERSLATHQSSLALKSFPFLPLRTLLHSRKRKPFLFNRFRTLCANKNTRGGGMALLPPRDPTLSEAYTRIAHQGAVFLSPCV